MRRAVWRVMDTPRSLNLALSLVVAIMAMVIAPGSWR